MCEALEELMKDELEAKKVEGITETILDLLFELGSVPELLQSEIMKQKNPEILKQWVKYAARQIQLKHLNRKSGRLSNSRITALPVAEIKKAGIRPIVKQFFIGEYLHFYAGVLI
mgnify:CR=1 FL=1